MHPDPALVQAARELWNWLTVSKAEEFQIVEAIAAFGAAQRNEERLRAIGLCLNPYGDEVQAMAGDEPYAVGRKIAAALRAARPEDSR